jgi:subtilase family serine protease
MEIKEVHTQAYLGPQSGTLKIDIDADNEVNESREDNNLNFFVNVKFQRF